VGVCRAVPEAPQEASGDCCNLGYARGICARFPETGGPDAVRFTVSRHEGTVVRIYYVVERDHLPFAHGQMEYSTTAAGFVAPFAAPSETQTLARQAAAYVESYLRRKES
jgi:hypothetical protein